MKALKQGTNLGSKRFIWFPCSIVLALLLTSFHTNRNEIRNDDTFTIVLDAGHGGHDPGNLGNGYYEKNIALNIVLNAGALLEKNPDINVIYTRKDDTFVDLYVRGEIANKANADLFVSVHCDSHTSQAHGAGTFVLGLHANKQNFEIAKKENSVIYLEDDYKSRYADYDINSPESVIGLTIMQEEFLDQSIALAKAIQDNFANKLNRVDRKVKQAGFIVLHQTFMPSVLVETGFLTNKEEGAYLNSKKGQSQMGTAIAEAVMTYKEDVMANIADFVDQAVTEAPDPDDRGFGSQGGVGKAEDKSKTSTTTAGQQGKAKDKAAKETAQIIEEAGRNSKEASKPSKEAMEEVIANADPEISAVSTDTPADSKKKETANTKDEIVYKVQLMASAKEFPLRPESFNGLNRVSKEPIKNLYRYVYGSTQSLREAKMLKSNADMKGYPTSFIVVYRNGERITFKESQKYISAE
ncbi:N-acetylmuramoyl-L-alanine amidase [Pricia sp.]|uniref:N-acetylmuramoyl-L-alanine amidase family protein n=1 Tax=Pricia sp. TaxID=2268138 RepID=UPI0035932A0E